MRGIQAGSKFVKADGDGLTEVHGGLAGLGGDDEEAVAESEMGAGEAVLLGAEDEGDAMGASQLGADERGELGQQNDGLFGPAVLEGCGAEGEGAVGDGLCERLGSSGALQKSFGTDGGLSVAPVGLVRGDNGEMGEAEVGHGPRCRADVEGVARRDQDDLDAIELGG